MPSPYQPSPDLSPPFSCPVFRIRVVAYQCILFWTSRASCLLANLVSVGSDRHASRHAALTRQTSGMWLCRCLHNLPCWSGQRSADDHPSASAQPCRSGLSEWSPVTREQAGNDGYATFYHSGLSASATLCSPGTRNPLRQLLSSSARRSFKLLLQDRFLGLRDQYTALCARLTFKLEGDVEYAIFFPPLLRKAAGKCLPSI